MFALAQNAGAKLSSTPKHASVLITALTMRRRLERHISWDIAKTKHIVSPQWLHACVEQDQLLPFSKFETIKSERRAPGPESPSGSATFSTSAVTAGPSLPKPEVSKGDYTHPLATHRRSPLVCPNQELCEELAVIMKSRFLEGEVYNELAYSRAIAMIKSYPKMISDVDEIRKLPGIGPKVAKYVDEFIKKGSIAKAREIAGSERFRILTQFTAIHGIGPTTAREHYTAGCRTIQDLITVYGPPRKDVLATNVLAALELQDELATRMSRSEVELISQSIFKELDVVQGGCEYTICGSYRRGKADHSDIDFIFTHREPGKEKHLCERLVDHLKNKNVITHVLNQSFFTSKHENTHGRQVNNRSAMDVLDKALVILKLPDLLHRRVDLICTPYSVYWTAIVGWTGSKQFERDLRLHAKQNGMKFTSGGITQLRNNNPIVTYSEQDTFKALGLEYVEPEMRNADV